jgi:hypothetical protein
MTVLEISSRLTAAPSERAEAQLPQRGSAAAVTEYAAGVAAAATTAVAAAEVQSGLLPHAGVPEAVSTAMAAAAAPLGAPSYWGQMSRKLRKNWMNRNKRV